ncbi:MAG: phage head morphogenesis protein [Campylobacteraceae bacterium]|jgi:SPP1 gp7 family putative phage head morphogenesis protein|nr:phage head morphogenesis protein [Campylobacteraceae bacterium]
MFSFNLPPEQNLTYLLKKKPELHYNYDEIMFEAHHRAFTVAKVTKADLLLDIQTSLLKAQKSGKSFESWAKEITPTLKKKGWWGEKKYFNPTTGEVREFKVGKSRLKTIYRTNMSVMDAQTRANEQYSSGAEYLRYVAIMDSRTRDMHKKLHGLILHRNSSFWKNNYPPNGWNCRCKTFAYTKGQIEKRGWTIAKYPPKWFKADKDWNYDTRNLEGSGDNTLAKVIEQKVNRIIDVNDPDKLIRSYLKESLWELAAERKRWAKLKKFIANPKGNFALSPLAPKLKSALKTESSEIFLSKDTLVSHTHHPEITAFDYYLVKYMQNNTLFAVQEGEFKVLLLKKLGKIYETTIKTTENKKEVYLVSMHLIKSKNIEKTKQRLLRKGKEIKI